MAYKTRFYFDPGRGWEYSHLCSVPPPLFVQANHYFYHALGPLNETDGLACMFRKSHAFHSHV